MEIVFFPGTVFTIKVFEPTNPAPFMLAISTDHMSASSIFFERRITFWALMHIEVYRLRVIIQLIILILEASLTYMFQLLAFHTDILFAA